MTKFVPFSAKQKAVLTWWNNPALKGYDAIICDGAVRSGKTLCMSMSFTAWAMSNFNGGSFALCGKTITSLKRNVVTPLLSALREVGFTCLEKASANCIDISVMGRKNRFYIFGGKDEGSASLIQGMTLCGVMFDEVALMPRSFVEQALARCSVTGSKLWFNCNPEHPFHWFYKEWIKKAQEKNALYMHFTMEDNPSLSSEIMNRYRTLYSGIFYDRFILGKWSVAQGAVYPLFNASRHVFSGSCPDCGRFVVSCDYGTVNPSSFGLWGHCDGVWYRLKEYYYSSREHGIARTDEEHYKGLIQLIGGRKIDFIVVDPSAASFIECIRRHGEYSVIPARNDVVAGICRVTDCLNEGRIMFHESCEDIIREFALYRWDDRGICDAPVKENDHAMDDLRYFVSAVLYGGNGDDDFFVMSLARNKV